MSPISPSLAGAMPVQVLEWAFEFSFRLAPVVASGQSVDWLTVRLFQFSGS
jgi:hypothetical protein